MIPSPDVIPFEDCPVEPLKAPVSQIHTFRPDYSSMKVNSDIEKGVLYVTLPIPVPFIHITITIEKSKDILSETRNFVDNFR
jgi:hypothetical protein